MKHVKFLSVLFVSLLATQFSFGQTAIQDSVLVNGNCGMCKKTIEKSAMAAGATTVSWNKTSKYLSMTYDPAKTNSNKIQTAVAKSGYDTQDVKAGDDAYKGLEECCQYDRKNPLLAPKKVNN
ncbi:MAG: copper chaperone [Ginsengibacter sp.]